MAELDARRRVLQEIVDTERNYVGFLKYGAVARFTRQFPAMRALTALPCSPVAGWGVRSTIVSVFVVPLREALEAGKPVLSLEKINVLFPTLDVLVRVCMRRASACGPHLGSPLRFHTHSHYGCWLRASRRSA